MVHDLMSDTRWRPGDRFTLFGKQWHLDGPAHGDPASHFCQDYHFVTHWAASTDDEQWVITAEFLDDEWYVQRLEPAV